MSHHADTIAIGVQVGVDNVTRGSRRLPVEDARVGGPWFHFARDAWRRSADFLFGPTRAFLWEPLSWKKGFHGAIAILHDAKLLSEKIHSATYVVQDG
jgi:hypothetical protein